MLRMSEVNAIDHQSMQHMLTAGAVDWDGFGDPLAQEANALLGSAQLWLLIDESGFAKKGERSAGGPAMAWLTGQGRQLPSGGVRGPVPGLSITHTGHGGSGAGR